jgi:hypothetical protein
MGGGISMIKRTLSTRRYKAGYEIRTEEVQLYDGDSVSIRKYAYTPDGMSIGESKRAHFLCTKLGIAPESIDETTNICSIGFCEKEQKWFGWSHRAIHGFGIGDVVKEGDCTASSGWTDDYIAEHPEADTSLPIGFVAEDFGGAKQMAIAFAKSVS